MASRAKLVAHKRSKCAREPFSLEELEFSVEEHQQRYERLRHLMFSLSCIIDWEALKEVGLDDEARELVFLRG